MNGYPIDSSHLDLDVYRLLLPFAASQHLHDLCDSDPSDPLNRMLEQFERSEACRLLLTIAVTIRNSVEKRDDPLVETHLEDPVGTLIEDVTNPGDTRLSFREACNKIIHATDVEFVLGQSKSERSAPITKKIKLFGAKFIRGAIREWEANLDVVEFARRAYSLA